MKKIIFALLIANYTFLNVNAQWLQEVRLTNDSGASYISYNRCIESNANFVHVIWYDNRDGNFEIYYKRSSDRGITWGSDLRLTNNPSVSILPSLAVNGLNIHVAWYDYRDGNPEIYYKNSTNGGLTWSNDMRLTNTSEFSRLPSLAVNNSNLYVVWEEKELYTDICFKRSTNGGLSWSIDTVLDNGTISSENPYISLSGATIHVAWEDSRDGYTNEIYYKRSNDGGNNWSPDSRLTINGGESLYPSICALGSVVHLTFQDNSNYHNEIYYKRSTNGGLTWGAIVNLSNIPNESWHPALSLSGSFVHLVWYNYYNDTPKIYYKRSTDEGTSWDPNIRLSDNSAISAIPSISVVDTMIHVVWSDYRDGNLEIYYKCNLNGNLVKIKNVNSLVPERFYLYQNYPNPFNPVTKVKFAVPLNKGGERGLSVRLVIYDVLGREVATLVNQQLKPGTYEVEWDAGNYPSGVYFYKLKAGDFTDTRKMILIK